MAEREPKGEAVSGLEFFELLRRDDEFCACLGRAVLAAGRLESALKQYLAVHKVDGDTRKATLGRLIHYCRKHDLLGPLTPSLQLLAEQRNYLAHSIHALLSDLIEETLLERHDLLDSDVATYSERARQLTENLNGLSNIVESRLRESNETRP